MLGLAAVTIIAPFQLGTSGTAWPQDAPKAAKKTQGQGTQIVLRESFVTEFMDRVTIQTDFRVDRVGQRHEASKDGEVHIAGVAVKAELPTVAELTNPETQDINTFLDRASQTSAADRTIALEGAWRVWTEHPGTNAQVQGSALPDRFDTSNPDHVFEIHPITKLGGHDLKHTFQPIPGFTPKDPAQAFLFYENTKCRIRKQDDNVRITAKGVGFNFVEFILEIGDEPPHVVDDGRLVLCQVRDTDGELILRRRMAFVKDTQPELRVRSMGQGDRLHVIGIPRVNLRLVKWRLDNAGSDLNDPDNPLNWDLPYEIVVVAVVEASAD
jgi:hypothetical protein